MIPLELLVTLFTFSQIAPSGVWSCSVVVVFDHFFTGDVSACYTSFVILGSININRIV